MTTVNKAQRATIKLGNIELDVFQLPNGNYVMSSTQVATSVGRTEKYYLPKYLSKELQSLLGDRLTTFQNLGKVTYDKTKINPLPLEIVPIFWAYESSKGNSNALNLVIACTVEALERRADSAFNVIRTEAERNDRITARMEGKIVRRTLTDAIKDYIDNHANELTNAYSQFVYSNCTDCINRAVFNMSSKQLKQAFGLQPNQLLRDSFTAPMLKEVSLVEEVACRIIDNEYYEPMSAVKLAIERTYPKLIKVQ